MTLYYIKRRHFPCIFTPQSLVWKWGTGTVHSEKLVLFIVISSHMLCTLYSYPHVHYAYVTYTLSNVMHTLLIRSQMLCIHYSYALKCYAYITHRLLIRMYTQRIRWYTLQWWTFVDSLGLNTQKLWVSVIFSEIFICYSYVLSYAVVWLHL